MPQLIEHHTWAPGPRLRVLVEAATWSTREQLTAILQRAGHDAAACPGPEGASQRCSLAAGHGCHAAEGCDVVVHALASWDPRNLEALRALRTRLPDTPVVVETPAIVAARLPTELEGCVVVEPPLRAGSLLAAVDRAVAATGSTEASAGWERTTVQSPMEVSPVNRSTLTRRIAGAGFAAAPVLGGAAACGDDDTTDEIVDTETETNTETDTETLELETETQTEEVEETETVTESETPEEEAE